MGIQMPKARQLRDRVVVDAAKLKERVLDDNDPLTEKEVRIKKYICRYCSAKVTPVAIGRINPQTNKPYENKPHFSLVSGQSHVKGYCEYRKQTNNSGTGAASKYPEESPIKGYPNSSGYPVVEAFYPPAGWGTKYVSLSREFRKSQYPPNRLLLDWLNSSDDKKSEARNRAHTPHNESYDSNNSNTSSDWATSSISQLVKYFLEPENRHLPLYIPGVKVNTYDTVFERIYFPGNHNQSKLRIYFAQLIYSRFSRMSNKYTFFLTDGSFEEDNLTPIIRSELVVDTSDWSSQDIKHFDEKIITFKKHAIKLASMKKLKKGGFLPWIFFLGYANSENGLPRLLHDDLRLIELCITEKLNDLSELPPLGSKSSHDNNEPKPNKPILKKKNDKVNSDSAELSSQSTDVQEVSESIFDRQAQTYSEPDNKHELELSRPNEDPLGQMQRTHDEIHRRKEMRTRARQQKQIQVLGKRAWKAVKGVFRQLMNFLRGR
jgi:hypothetical protein